MKLLFKHADDDSLDTGDEKPVPKEYDAVDDNTNGWLPDSDYSEYPEGKPLDFGHKCNTPREPKEPTHGNEGGDNPPTRLKIRR